MPVSGAWRFSYSLVTALLLGDEINIASIYRNNRALVEMEHQTIMDEHEIATVRNTGGRATMVHAKAGDAITLVAMALEGHFAYITFCAEFISEL